MNSSMMQFEEQVAGTCLENSNWFEFMGLVTGTRVGPCELILKQKWRVHKKSRDFLQGLVLSCFPTFKLS